MSTTENKKLSFSDQNVLRVITWIQDKVLNSPEKLNWQKMWTSGAARNYVTDRPYTGVNCLTCWLAGASLLLTDSQIAALDGERWENGIRVSERKFKIHVKEGTKKIPIIISGRFIPKASKRQAQQLYQHLKSGQITQDEYDEKIDSLKIFMTNLYWETKAEDVVNLPQKKEKHTFKAIASAEEIASAAPCPVYYDSPADCYYSPSKDEIHLVNRNSFKTSEAFYTTLLHEIGHSTGQESRCDRKLHSDFGSEEYSKEELVAEIFSAIAAEAAGLSGQNGAFEKQNSIAYIQGWLSELKDHPSTLTIAVAQAQKAWNWFVENQLGKKTENADETATETTETAEKGEIYA